MFHLLLAISAHGYGHLAQAAPVANALARIWPELRLTIRSALPTALLRSRIHVPFRHEQEADDFGLVQTSAFDMDLKASAEAYRRFHENWPDRVEAAAARLSNLGADLVLADVPYLTLAAAERAGVPSIAICSLNWADIYAHYFGRDAIHGQIADAYRSAAAFLRPAPSMPMTDLGSSRAVGPVVEAGANRRGRIDQVGGFGGGERLVLVALGGLRARLPLEHWPRMPGVRWLVPDEWGVQHPDAVPIGRLELPFSEVLASVDLLITKPGYGSFSEAAACGLPVAYIPRSDWPEEPYLIEWLERRGHAAALSRADADEGRVADIIRRLLAAGRYRPVQPAGVGEAVRAIAAAAGRDRDKFRRH